MKNSHRKVPPSFPFWVDDWIGGTYWMTAEQEACYLRLVLWQWKDGGIPNDENQMVSRTRVSIDVLRDVLRDKFELKDGFWINGKAKSVRDHEITRVERLRSNGLRGGRPSKTKSKPDGSLRKTKSKPKEEVGSRKNLNKKKEIESFKNVALPFDDSELRDAWCEYVELRDKQRYTLSERVTRRLVRFLGTECNSSHEAIACVEKAINGSWKDFHVCDSWKQQSNQHQIKF